MILMFLGGQPATAPFVIASKLFTLSYFAYLLLSIPLLNLINSLSANLRQEDNYLLTLKAKKNAKIKVPT